jgi:hypothetical protein
MSRTHYSADDVIRAYEIGREDGLAEARHAQPESTELKRVKAMGLSHFRAIGGFQAPRKKARAS